MQIALPLSRAPAQPQERNSAFFMLAVSTGAFVALASFAQVKLWPVPEFIPVYQGLLFLSDVLTALVLIAEYRVQRTVGLLVLSLAYSFTALAIVPHTLSFPGVFSSQGLMGAGPQTTAWLYMFWHSGFPLLVLVYALCREHEQPIGHPYLALGIGLAAVAAAVVGFTALATRGHDWMPALMAGNGYTFAQLVVMTTVWALSMVALAVLWLQGEQSTLDFWMMVVMAAWIFDIGLSGALNASRYDLGWYSGRLYGLLAASFVVVMLVRQRAAATGR